MPSAFDKFIVGQKYTTLTNIYECVFKDGDCVVLKNTAGNQRAFQVQGAENFSHYVEKKKGIYYIVIYEFNNDNVSYKSIFSSIKDILIFKKNYPSIKILAFIEVPWEEGQGLDKISSS